MPDAISVDRALSKATTLARAGHYLEAHRLYHEVLDRYPRNRRAAEGLKALRAPQRPGKGRDGARLRQDLAAIGAHQKAGRVNEALAAAARAAAAHPDAMPVHLTHGALRLATGDPRGAIESFTRAIQAQPTCPDPYLQLGHALKAAGETLAALEAFATAIALAPDDAEPRLQRGALLKDLGQHADAVDDFAAVAALRPESADAQNTLGNALARAGRHGDAVAAYRAALRLRPDFPEAHNNLGVALFEMGDPEAARPLYARAIALKADYAEAHRNLSLITRYRPGDAHLSQMRALYDGAEIGEPQRMHLAFALFKALDDIDETDEAFACLAAGNRLRAARHPYDAAQVRRTHDGLKAFFGEAGPLPVTVPEPGDRTPIFIVGMPRSGTTLIEQILASHPAVDSAGEIMAFERALLPHGEAIRRATVSTLPADIPAAIRRDYLAALDKLAPARRVVTDKMLVNARWIGFIAMAFPEAPIIHLKRDAIATCWSIYKHFFASFGNNYAYDQRDVAAHYRIQADLMAYWKRRLPGRIHEICYEELVDDQQHETRRLLAACGLPWDPACLAFHTAGRAVATASTAQVRKALYRGSGEAWRRYAAHLTEMIAQLEPATTPAAPPDRPAPGR
ncbi:tetratricopeptide repeat-containing sulfotransferase family protein [Acuticoccus kandeliae]|uniref:tetratricopeptide repeat-containing sulfotransferase family protein n=1 Tax=Acuticoccus kandeliae TaxID=2073160 RepID=UPI000D3EA3D3|nr:sulfotransferase [Acuticoccus kandeliae]